MRLFLVLALIVFAAGCGQKPVEKTEPKILGDRGAWKKIAKGMTQEKVKAVLGEPAHVESQEKVTAWYYQQSAPLIREERGWVIPRGAVLFSSTGSGGPTLTTWREP
jgi:hypothetical protein